MSEKYENIKICIKCGLENICTFENEKCGEKDFKFYGIKEALPKVIKNELRSIESELFIDRCYLSRFVEDCDLPKSIPVSVKKKIVKYASDANKRSRKLAVRLIELCNKI